MKTRALLLATAVAVATSAFAQKQAPKPGPFFEADFPFYQTQVDLTTNGGPLAENFAVRGIVIPLPSGHAIAFDQDLLRFAGAWAVPADQPLVTLTNMAQTSYSDPHRKCGAEHARPTGEVFFATRYLPGAATSEEGLRKDPRPPNLTRDLGRGPLPSEHGRFEGVEICGPSAVLRYRVGQTEIREWHEVRDISGQTLILRHFALGEQREPARFAIGPAVWSIHLPRIATCETAGGRKLAVATNSNDFTLMEKDGELCATLAPGVANRRVSLALVLDANDDDLLPGQIGATPPLPSPTKERRWPHAITTQPQLDSVRANGLAMDRIPLPEDNPWKRRVRPADIAFLTSDRAAVVTYDGDVWLADGLKDRAPGKVAWHRFASGLHESLALAVVNGVVQVATKNGLVRLHDRDGNGEADWYENFSDVMRQSQSTRTFPLDMDLGPDGSTYVTAGGISMGGGGTSFTGSLARISPDGRTAELISTGAREPFATVHPRTGLITGTDQQGQFIPSSACYLIRPGDEFGFGLEKPAKLTPPLVWIPHTEDNSSSSQVWLTNEKFGPLREQLMHLSYGNGGLFLITPDLDAPVPQGAIIPLGFETQIPLLQAQVQPENATVWLTGFQIYDSRTANLWGFGRLRLSGEPLTRPISAQSCAQGVILRFAAPLQAESVRAEQITAQSWNYLRSKAYGSGRYRRDGTVGMDAIGVSQAVLSTDRKSVFIHLPELTPVMQLEVRHAFQFENGAAAGGVTYFTIHQPRQLDLAKVGFPSVDLRKITIVSRPQTDGTASAELGKTLGLTMGCVACHSTDDTREGKTGPTWKGLFGIDREFADGSVESANEFYLRDSILNPQRKIVKGYAPGMASYQGVLSDPQIESLILYIKSLK